MQYDHSKLSSEATKMCSRFDQLILEFEGAYKESISIAMADTLIRICVSVLGDDEEDFRERLRGMYGAFIEYQEVWNEIQKDVAT